MNILESAVCLGLSTNALLNSTEITYRRANKTISLSVQKAEKPRTVNALEVFGLVMVPHDWIIKKSDLKDLFPPQEGDVISADGETFRVCEGEAGTPCWRTHTGSGGQYLRVHSEISGGN